MQIKKLYKMTAEMTFDLEFFAAEVRKNLMFLMDFDCGNVLHISYFEGNSYPLNDTALVT